jgi:hypothetical protein
MNSVIIGSSGQISIPTITAASGSARDIQAAVDWIVAHGGIGNVYIPEGTFNFVDVGEAWMTVNIPGGVNLFGAPTERDANGQVVEWKTVLVMPYDVAGPRNTEWFRINGNGKSFRMADIKLVGYRYFNSSSTYVFRALSIVGPIVDFRIDHCHFQDTTGGIGVGGPANSVVCGVIDHCKLVNSRAIVKPYVLDCDVDYGVGFIRSGTTFWDDNIDNVLGHYTGYTVFIEDCYFEKWRHCVSANDGAHYVFRHNVIKNDVGYGSLDAHGTYNYVGTRAVEIYENQMIDPVGSSDDTPLTKDGVYIRGGGGVIFNNTVVGYENRFIYTSREGSVEKCWPHDLWIWNNAVTGSSYYIQVYNDPDKGAPQENVDYFLYAKAEYTPYPYPHPLTLEITP